MRTGDLVLDQVKNILDLRDVAEGAEDKAEEIGSVYYQTARRIASFEDAITCLSDALSNTHSVEELEVLAKLYASDSICGLLDDPYAEDLSNNTKMVEGITKAMVHHSDPEKLCIFGQILDRFCRGWYVGKTEEDAARVRVAIVSVCSVCPEIADEMSKILDLVEFCSVPKVKPEPPEIPKLTLHQRIFGI